MYTVPPRTPKALSFACRKAKPVDGTLDDGLVDLTTKEQAAEILGVSPRTLDRWHRLQMGPPRINIGRQVRYRPSTIKRWLVERENAGAVP